MQEVIKLFKQIQATSSLNDKKKIITDNKNNELFKKCLKFLLDNNVVTGISDAKLSKEVPIVRGFIRDFEAVISYLSIHNYYKLENYYILRFFLFYYYMMFY